MKMPIAWHEACLTSLRADIAYYERQYQEAKNRLHEVQAAASRLEAQIISAKLRKKAEFDGEKWCGKPPKAHT